MTLPSAEAATPDAPIPVDVEVDLAQALRPEDRPKDAFQGFRYWNIDLVPEWAVFAVIGLLIGARVVGAQTGAPTVLFITLALVIGGMVWIVKTASRSRTSSEFRYFSQAGRRIRVLGWPVQLREAQRMIAEAAQRGGTEHFEPELFRIAHAKLPWGGEWNRGAFCAAIAVAALVGAPWIFGLHPLGLFLPSMGFLGAYAVGAAVAALMRAIWGFLWPTYVRVLPRRVEVHRYGFLGAGEPHVEAFDVGPGGCRVLIDLRYGRVLLEGGVFPGGRWLSGVVNAPIRGGRAMGLAVLAAALSRFEALAEDEQGR